MNMDAESFNKKYGNHANVAIHMGTDEIVAAGDTIDEIQAAIPSQSDVQITQLQLEPARGMNQLFKPVEA